jgi:pSer/pThr/pTyr-binding forkhead associated (FHA) protein
MIWEVKDGPLFLGRDSSNQVEVRDTRVSRRHCSVSEASSGVFEVADLDSHNGTLVNGNAVSRKTIQHGDRICIGAAEFVFLTGADDAQALSSAPGSDSSGDVLKTMSLDDAGLPADSTGIGRVARDLCAFLKIANVINSTRDTRAMQRELLSLISEVVPAAQGAIVLQPSANDDPSAPCAWNRNSLSQPELVIREELVRQATWERSAIFTAASADTASGEHALCVPLIGIERIVGVIYLSSPASSPAFSEDHAYFLSSVSALPRSL